MSDLRSDATSADPTFRVEVRAEEPWVQLATGRDLADWTREDAIVYAQTRRQAAKVAFYADVYDFLVTHRIDGDYHEYGCHRGRTFRMSLTEARRHRRDAMKFFAFDSFEGLPATARGAGVDTWTPGALATSEAEFRALIAAHAIYVDRCVTVKGFYQDTLTPQRQARFLAEEHRIALACVDCDLYESAVPVFRFIEPLLQEGSVIYVDDFFVGHRGSPRQGVARAFAEFEAASRFRFRPHLQVGWWGTSFIAYREDA